MDDIKGLQETVLAYNAERHPPHGGSFSDEPYCRCKKKIKLHGRMECSNNYTNYRSILYKCRIRGHGTQQDSFERLFSFEDFLKPVQERSIDISAGLNVEAAVNGDKTMLMRVVKYVMQVVHREHLQHVPLAKWNCMICGSPGKIMENEILTSLNERPQPLIR